MFDNSVLLHDVYMENELEQDTSAVEVARIGLCRMIATGELSAGERLPSEAQLCESFGVSRGSLREAQKMLMVAGVLTSRRGSRISVSDMSADRIMSGLAMVIPLLPLDRFLQLFNLRAVLEGHAAAQATAKFTDAERRQVADVAEELTNTEPSDKAQWLDAKFHSLILRGAEDPMIEALMETVRKRGRDYRVFENEQYAELKAVSDQAHRDIAQAIMNRDPESARYLSMQHVRMTQSWLEGIRPTPILFEDDSATE